MNVNKADQDIRDSLAALERGDVLDSRVVLGNLRARYDAAFGARSETHDHPSTPTSD